MRWRSCAHIRPGRIALSAACALSGTWLAVAGANLSAQVGLPDFSKITTEQEFADYVIKYRADLDAAVSKPTAAAILQDLPVKFQATKIAGVPVEDFMPLDGVSPANKNRALINLHGGAFIAGAVYLGRVESAPIANLGRIRVISVDYRQGHEHKFPAASQDVAAVYQALLEQYPPRNIGVYGCSAGGSLTAQAMAWMLDKKLASPGAIGIFGSGMGGTRLSKFGYFAGISPTDRLAFPFQATDLHAKYPPTLFVTGTKAFDMAPALAGHRALTRAGADASLQVFENMGHCFIYQHRQPEAQDAYATIIRFFDRHLGR